MVCVLLVVVTGDGVSMVLATWSGSAVCRDSADGGTVTQLYVREL